MPGIDGPQGDKGAKGAPGLVGTPGFKVSTSFFCIVYNILLNYHKGEEKFQSNVIMF
jgi:hypothetical protein